MFIKLRHGKGEESVLNPNCSQINFLVHVAELSHWDGIGVLDVCDIRGQRKHLSTTSNKSALEVLTYKETYVPIAVVKSATPTRRGSILKNQRMLLNEHDELYLIIRAAMEMADVKSAKFRRSPHASANSNSSLESSRSASSKLSVRKGKK